MKSLRIVVVSITAIGIVMATPSIAENLFDNSSMDSSSSWRGDRDYEAEPGNEENRVIVLEANERRAVSFYQDVNTTRIKDLIFKFRYKSDNYKGRGYQTRGIRTDRSSTFRNRTVEADGEWHEVEWRFSEIRGSRRIRFEIELLEGEGEVLFDDVTVEEM